MMKKNQNNLIMEDQDNLEVEKREEEAGEITTNHVF
jgi:hypothetical protein